MNGPARAIKTSVLIVGGGPVGMTLAMDLAWRGIDVIVAERRPANDPPSVKCGQISARSMEVFRRLGVADKQRQVGLPPDYPNDIVSATSVVGIELSRVPIPARGERGPAAKGPDTSWPTPEHTHRVNQKFFEPVLIAHVAAQPRVRLLNRTEVYEITQYEEGVTALARDLDSGERTSIDCAYLVGCDGSSSMVRKAIGAAFVGTPVLQHAQSTYIRAPALLKLLPGKPAWLYFSLNPRRCGVTMAVDGRETWNIQNFSYPGEADLNFVDGDWATRMILGVGPDFEYEVRSTEDWVARRLVAGVIFLVLISGAGIRATPGVLIVPLEEEFGWTRASISLAIGINIFIYGFIGPFAAAAMQRFGIRRVVIFALSLLSGAVAASTLIAEEWQLILTWGVLVGLGSGGTAMVLGATIATRWFTARREGQES